MCSLLEIQEWEESQCNHIEAIKTEETIVVVGPFSMETSVRGNPVFHHEKGVKINTRYPPS